MDAEKQDSIKHQIAELISEHRDLDEVIDNLYNSGTVDQLLISRLKKRKLRLKDQITRLESKLIPDLEA